MVAVLNLLTFILAAYNCKKYLCTSKDNRLLVIMFYVFVFTDTLNNMSDGIYDAITRRLQQDKYDTVFGSIRSFNLACICLTDALTMFSLAISIQVALGTKDTDKAADLHKVAYILATIFLLSYMITILLVHLGSDDLRHYVRAITNFSIIIVSACILLYLKMTFNQFGAHDSKEAIRSIVIQFVVYLLAYCLLFGQDIWKIFF